MLRNFFLRSRNISFSHHHIVIEGPVGVGKTSLAKMLAEKINGQVMLEHAEENPFLPKFYQNPEKYRFQTQIFFLLRRYQQALEFEQIDLFKSVMISDYLFEKDRVFARNNLDDKEYWLYEQLFHLLKRNLTPPDLVVFLQARTEVLMERIRKRGKDFEKSISYKYLDQINQAFNEFFFHFNDELILLSANDPAFI